VELHVTFEDRHDLSGQIYRQIRSAILDGRLRAGAPLPPSRDLAGRLEVSRNTVNVAYERLAAEGYVSGRVGAGTFITGVLHPVGSAHVGSAATQPAARALWADIPLPRVALGPGIMDLRPGLPDFALFPFQAWRRLLSAQFRASAMRNSEYGDPAGHPGLRSAIAAHIGVSRGVRVKPDDVLVTNGTQQAIDLIARVLLAPGDAVAVEHPGYPPPRLLFTSLGAHVHHVPVDAEGIVVDEIPEGVRLVYVTPSHQFPLGMPMSLLRRTQLLAWASRTGATIIEDDYDTEFRFTGRPIEPLHALDSNQRVIYVGSFSKVLLPALRLGFLVAPESLHRPLRAAKFVTDWHTELPGQSALAAFIDGGRNCHLSLVASCVHRETYPPLVGLRKTRPCITRRRYSVDCYRE